MGEASGCSRSPGKHADIVGINPNLGAGEVNADVARSTLAETTAQKIDWVRAGAGDRFDEIELQIRYFMAAITDDARGFAEMLAPSFGIDARRSPRVRQSCWSGRSTRSATPSWRRREEWGVSYVVIGDDLLEAFAPVVARLAGT